LSGHRAAAFVLARRGQKFPDRLKPSSRKRFATTCKDRCELVPARLSFLSDLFGFSREAEQMIFNFEGDMLFHIVLFDGIRQPRHRSALCHFAHHDWPGKQIVHTKTKLGNSGCRRYKADTAMADRGLLGMLSNTACTCAATALGSLDVMLKLYSSVLYAMLTLRYGARGSGRDRR
jgi:hypothetical protein